MNFPSAIRTCFQKYAAFEGRALRSEYWWFALFLFVASIVTDLMDIALFGLMSSDFGPLNTLFSLGTLIPSLAAGARRLHDRGRSGWWQLLWIVPVIGWIVLLYWLVTEGDAGPNCFGPHPLEDQPARPDPLRHPRRSQRHPHTAAGLKQSGQIPPGGITPVAPMPAGWS